MFGTFDIAASGLNAQRTRLDIIANNMANINSTRNFKGELEPYTRKLPVFASGTELNPNEGVTVTDIVKDNSSGFRLVYDPAHKDANDEGYVKYPNIYPEKEWANAIMAQRAYEFNASSMEIAKAMFVSTLRLIA